MKKFLKNKIKKVRGIEDEEQRPARITNETVAEHREQILAGGPITITTADMTRFLLPLSYAVTTIATAIKLAHPGETFIPKIPAALITDVAKAMIGDLAMANGCFSLGVGPEADGTVVAAALAHWLSAEGQESRQEQVRDGMALVDGMGASRVAQELWNLIQ